MVRVTIKQNGYVSVETGLLYFWISCLKGKRVHKVEQSRQKARCVSEIGLFTNCKRELCKGRRKHPALLQSLRIPLLHRPFPYQWGGRCPSVRNAGSVSEQCCQHWWFKGSLPFKNMKAMNLYDFCKTWLLRSCSYCAVFKTQYKLSDLKKTQHPSSQLCLSRFKIYCMNYCSNLLRFRLLSAATGKKKKEHPKKSH